MEGATQVDIREFLSELQSTGPLLSTHRKKIEACMRHFADAGLTLATCADERHLGRAISTLKDYAREFRLRFPDYCPYDMRKRVTFQMRGHFWEFVGGLGDARSVAAAVGIVHTAVPGSKNQYLVAIPVHCHDMLDKLRASGFILNLVKAKKSRKKREAA